VEKPSTPNREIIANELKQITRSEASLASLPLKYVGIVREQTTHQDSEVRSRTVNLVRDWVNYANEHNPTEDDPFSIRYHVARFAAETFGHKREHADLRGVDIHDVASEGKSYQDIISRFVSTDILSDNNVAIVGGTARLALKMYAGVEISDEIPISDVDIVASTNTDIASKAKEYGVDLSGAKIVEGDVRLALPDLVTNFDCTMNQVAVCSGNLLFTDQALVDIRDGNIRIIAKDDPLFGSEGVVMADGNVYLNRNGFYRGLSFLLRGKGKRLIVSQENIEAEKDNIGRYWLVMLFVKIMTMKDDEARRNSIAHWHEVALRIGSTEAKTPESFLNELREQYPEMKSYGTKENSFDNDAQARWIIGKLAKKAVNTIFDPRSIDLPQTYTAANLELSENTEEYDYESFTRACEAYLD